MASSPPIHSYLALLGFVYGGRGLVEKQGFFVWGILLKIIPLLQCLSRVHRFPTLRLSGFGFVVALCNFDTAVMLGRGYEIKASPD